MPELSGRRRRLAPHVLSAMLPSFGAVLVWLFLGSLNREIAQSVEYSLGTSAGWHDWLARGNPGEVIRKWGVPLYDQWAGLGYRLPTQGMLSDTPLSYLSLILPINAVMLLAFVASLWFAFVLLHRWVDSWSANYQVLTRITVDCTVIGMISFYTLWHGWQTYIIQIAGALVIMATLTKRQVIETPSLVQPAPFTTCLSLGLFMLMAPHFGYAMTYVPALFILFLVVALAQQAVLLRKILRSPWALAVPLLITLSMTPYVLDLVREMQLQSHRPDYRAELGVLDFAFRQGGVVEASAPLSWVISAILIVHTSVFPLVALFDPGAYSQAASPGVVLASWNASAWPIRVVQFHGGLLAIALAAWLLRRPRSHRVRVIERVVVVLMLTSLLVSLFNTSFVPGFSLSWVPVWLLSNSRWTHADLSLLLCLVLLVWRSDDVWKILFNRPIRTSVRGQLIRVGVAFGLLCLACLLPYRVIESLRVNDGQTRFSPLQIDAQTRAENEQWRVVLDEITRNLYGTSDVSPPRVMFEGEGMMGAEGDNVWWGLRTHSQLRDVRLSTLLSWPRLRSGETLTKGDKFQHIVSDPVCDSSIRSRLDFLSVSWSMLSSDCTKRFLNTETQVKVPMPPSWTNVTSNRSLLSIMPEMVARTTFLSEGDVTAVKLSSYHEWWANDGASSRRPCPMLVEDCIAELGLLRGARVDSPPLRVCPEGCVATYQVTKTMPSTRLLVIPLNYDPSVQPVQAGKSLETVNFHGLLAISSAQVESGQIIFTLQPDTIMILRALSPVVLLVALIVACLVGLSRDTLGGIAMRLKLSKLS